MLRGWIASRVVTSLGGGCNLECAMGGQKHGDLCALNGLRSDHILGGCILVAFGNEKGKKMDHSGGKKSWKYASIGTKVGGGKLVWLNG